MSLRRSLRRFVASATAVLFLACQGVAAAGVHAPAPPRAGTEAPMAPCHDVGGEAGQSAGGCPAGCEFQNASSTPSKVVYSMIDLPAIAVAFDRFLPVVNPAPPVVSWLARIEPPPIRILHCCLRN